MSEVPDYDNIPEGARVIRPVMFEDFGQMADADFRPTRQYEEDEVDPKVSTASETVSAIHPSVLPATSVSTETVATQTNSTSSDESSEESSPVTEDTEETSTEVRQNDDDVIPMETDLDF